MMMGYKLVKFREGHTHGETIASFGRWRVAYLPADGLNDSHPYALIGGNTIETYRSWRRATSEASKRHMLESGTRDWMGHP